PPIAPSARRLPCPSSFRLPSPLSPVPGQDSGRLHLIRVRRPVENPLFENDFFGNGGCTLQLILDIGTHKVLGLVSRPAGDGGLEVVAARYVRHPQRSMRDGQVHDVPAVGRVIRQVKEHLEQAAGTSFSGAHIAAAGRALRTERGEAQQTHPRPVHFSASMLRHLEWEAVADAQANLLRRLPADEQPKGYYCIAHNVTASRLDGDPIDLLVGQRGEAFAVQVLATFLPGAVVDSLEAALGEAGLEMLGLTLE